MTNAPHCIEVSPLSLRSAVAASRVAVSGPEKRNHRPKDWPVFKALAVQARYARDPHVIRHLGEPEIFRKAWQNVSAVNRDRACRERR
jgi:hypothetical protein